MSSSSRNGSKQRKTTSHRRDGDDYTVQPQEQNQLSSARRGSTSSRKRPMPESTGFPTLSETEIASHPDEPKAAPTPYMATNIPKVNPATFATDMHHQFHLAKLDLAQPCLPRRTAAAVFYPGTRRVPTTLGLHFEFANNVPVPVPHYAIPFSELFQQLMKYLRLQQPRPSKLLWVRQNASSQQKQLLDVRNDQVVASLITTRPEYIRQAVLAALHHYPEQFPDGMVPYLLALRFVDMSNPLLTYNSDLMWGILSHLSLSTLRTIWFLLMQTRPQSSQHVPQDGNDNALPSTPVEKNQDADREHDHWQSLLSISPDKFPTFTTKSTMTPLADDPEAFFEAVLANLPIRKLPSSVDNVLKIVPTTGVSMGSKAPRCSVSLPANPGDFVHFRVDNTAPANQPQTHPSGPIQDIVDGPFWAILDYLLLMIRPLSVSITDAKQQRDLPSERPLLAPLCALATNSPEITDKAAFDRHKPPLNCRSPQDMAQLELSRRIRGFFHNDHEIAEHANLPQRVCTIPWDNLNDIDAKHEQIIKTLNQRGFTNEFLGRYERAITEAQTLHHD